MADKSPKDQGSSTDADGGDRKPMHKQTAKTVQDGVELSWDMLREGELKPEEAADFYVSSVEALKKFRDRDPRTEPVLRKAKKLKDDRDKAFNNLFLGIVVGLALAFLLSGGFRGCADSSYDSPRHYYRR
jgi:hypothetical protein